MRTLALVLLVGLIGLAGGFYAGSEAGQRARVAGAQAALRRATEAITVGRSDEALQFAFAALDRDPELYGAYEVAGDAVAMPRHDELARHFYRAALGGVDKGGKAESADFTAASPPAVVRARLQAKLAALSAVP